ncbi:hypothetical protein EON64_01095 [archaeon]|nr:MAG: hypothetical protein EON64_01095 [archaeon]
MLSYPFYQRLYVQHTAFNIHRTLQHIFGHSTGANLGGALVIASLVAWRGPPYLASMMLRYEQQLRYLKLKRDRAEREGPSNQPRCKCMCMCMAC